MNKEKWRKFKKSLGKDIGWLALSRILASFKKDGDIRVIRRRFEFVGKLAFIFARSRRKVLLSNLATVFPEWNDVQIKETAKNTIRNISRGFVDSFYYSYHPHMIPDKVVLENNGVLEDIILRKSGCVVVTGHVGTFPFLGVPMVAQGISFGPIVRDPHDLRVKHALDDVRERIGYTLIPDRPPFTVLKKSAKLIRKGGAVMVAFDMNPSWRTSTTVKFLGSKTPMFNYAVRLAAIMKVPIIPGHVLLEPDGLTHRVTYYSPIDVPMDATDPDSTAGKDILQGLADWLSGVIRKYPEQYWWIHRRWRDKNS